jgi:hypothetical protein
MRGHWLCLFVWLAVAAAGRDCARAEESLELPMSWNKGDVRHYELVKSRKKTGAAQRAIDSTTHTPLVVEVLAADEEEFLIAWTLGETKFTGAAQGNLLAQKVANMMTGMKVTMRVNREGNVQEVVNWQEIRDLVAKFLNLMSDELKKTGMDERSVRTITAQVSAAFSTKEQIRERCTREAQMFFLPTGGGYSTDGRKYEDRLPNPLGGEPIPASAEFVLKSVDRNANTATILWKQAADPAEARRILIEMAKTQAAQLGKKLDAGDTGDVAFSDVAEFKIDLTTGWPDHIDYRRTITVSGETQVDAMVISSK